jgi:hypothetical protein
MRIVCRAYDKGLRLARAGPGMGAMLADERHLAIRRAGSILVQVGPEQDKFIEFFERQLAPALAHRKAA